MVGVLGFEPRTSSLSGTRSNQLSYTPLNPLKVPPFGHGPRVFCFAKASGTFRGPRSPAFRAAPPYSCLRDWMMSARTGSYQISRPVIFLDLSIKVRQRSTATSRSGTLPPAERRPRDVSPRSLARLNQSSGSFSGIPCGFAVLMPARLDDVCQNRLIPNCPARYFLIFRSRCDNGAPRHIGAARLPPAERRPRNVSPRSLARLNQSSVSLTSVSTKSGAEGARTLDILLAKQVL